MQTEPSSQSKLVVGVVVIEGVVGDNNENELELKRELDSDNETESDDKGRLDKEVNEGLLEIATVEVEIEEVADADVAMELDLDSELLVVEELEVVG